MTQSIDEVWVAYQMRHVCTRQSPPEVVAPRNCHPAADHCFPAAFSRHQSRFWCLIEAPYRAILLNLLVARYVPESCMMERQNVGLDDDTSLQRRDLACCWDQDQIRRIPAAIKTYGSAADRSVMQLDLSEGCQWPHTRIELHVIPPCRHSTRTLPRTRLEMETAQTSNHD